MMDIFLFAATVACIQYAIVGSILMTKLMLGSFDTKSNTVNLDNVKGADNSWTMYAAKEHAAAAIANQKAAEANLKAEELRMERIRLQKD